MHGEMCLKFLILISFVFIQTEARSAEESETEKFEHWQKIAETGDAEAEFKVGECFDNGHGVKENHETALQWFLKAAAKNHVNACFSAGLRLEQSNPQLALQYYVKAARLGDDRSAGRLGFTFDGGRQKTKQSEVGIFKSPFPTQKLAGVNLHEARRWYSLAASKGNTGVLNNLAVMLWFGEGGPTDQIEACRFWKIAGKKDDSLAKDNLETASKYLNPVLLNEAFRRAEIPLVNQRTNTTVRHLSNGSAH